MVQLGYALSSEEHLPNALVRYAQRAEEVGFAFALISDHYHPWIDQQGQSPFVWSVIGGIAQAAATAAAMMPGRFVLGVGTGENLNEHILGDHWPPHDVRLEMLEEAVRVIRLLWQGGPQTYHGCYYTVENAQVYTLPDDLPPVLVAASGPKAAEAAGRLGDGLISTAPQESLSERFEAAGGAGKPRYGQLTVCWAKDEASAQRTAHTYWPNAGLKGELSQELPTPAHFAQASQLVREDDVAQRIVCGPDPARHIDKIQEFAEAGYDHVYVHQVGPDQEGFFHFYSQEVLPKLR